MNFKSPKLKRVWLAVNKNVGKVEMSDTSLQSLINTIESQGLDGKVYYTKGVEQEVFLSESNHVYGSVVKPHTKNKK